MVSVVGVNLFEDGVLVVGLVGWVDNIFWKVVLLLMFSFVGGVGVGFGDVVVVFFLLFL